MLSNPNSLLFTARTILGQQHNEKLISVSNFSAQFSSFAEKLPMACKQLSQITAWMWLSQTDEQKQNLQAGFKQVLEAQAIYSSNHYDDTLAAQLSQQIADFLTGKQPECGLSLPKLYQELTGLDSYVFDEEFTNLFYFEVSTDTFEGYITGFDFTKKKFRVVLAYPPRPELNEFNVTEDTLRNWSQNVPDQWLPPSAFIPISTS
jgi:hypothetical protein